MSGVSLIEHQRLVSRDSACLGGHGRTALDASHAMMNKFSGPYDGKYLLLVSSCIKRLLEVTLSKE